MHSKGIMHRDIKLENIMIKRPVNFQKKLSAVLIDFGLAEYVNSL